MPNFNITLDDVPDIDYPVTSVFGEDAGSLLEELKTSAFNFEAEIKEVRDIQFKLADHPEDDVVSFNELYAQVQANQSRVTAILMDLHNERAKWMRFQQRIKRIVRKLRNDILAGFTAERLKELKNKEVIEAQVQGKMPEWFDLEEYVENVLENIDHMIDTVVLKRDDLGNANVNMSRQQKAVDTLVGLQYPVMAKRMEGNQ